MNIQIEGYAPEELLTDIDGSLHPLIFSNTPIVFTAGTAEILGQFRIENTRLVIQLAQIDGGGEGVLPTLWMLANQYAIQHDLDEIEWIVHAVNCAKPNLKLRRLLVRRGFTIREMDGIGEVYHLMYHPDRSNH